MVLMEKPYNDSDNFLEITTFPEKNSSFLPAVYNTRAAENQLKIPLLPHSARICHSRHSYHFHSASVCLPVVLQATSVYPISILIHIYKKYLRQPLFLTYNYISCGLFPY